MLTQAPRGTKDVLPAESHQWQWLEEHIAAVCNAFGYREIRTPVFEHTELFERGVGDTTDVVQKEMYTFDDKGGRSITLRPEGTASVGRAYLEHNLYADIQPCKLFYNISCYRYEKRRGHFPCYGTFKPRRACGTDLKHQQHRLSHLP